MADESVVDGEEVPSEEQAAEVEGAAPDWVVLPPDLKIPPGRVVAFLMFRAHWTDTPNKGDRQCVVWNLTDTDEKLALKRSASGDAMTIAGELSRQAIRAVDGVKVNWMQPTGPGSIDQFWREIGSKCRQMVTRWYTQNHMLTQAEQTDFFENCVVLRTMG